jgi:neutral amino acid transport system permease protein
VHSPPSLRAALIGILFLAALVAQVATSAPAAAQAAEGPSVEGTIDREDESGEELGVEGVEIVVSTADGEEVGRATTDAEGAFQIQLPGPGEYEALVVEETLPEDASLRNPDRNPLTVTVGADQARRLLFPLGEGDGGGGSGMGRQALQLFVEGIKFGLIIAITSVGLSLVFGTTGLVNFAHGELVSFGALIAYFFNVTLGIHLIPAAVIAVVVGALFGALQDLILWRPLRRRGTTLIAMLVVSVGLGLFWRYGMLYQFGGGTRPYGQYAIQRAVDMGPIQIAPKDVISIALSGAVLVAVALMLQYTRIGKAMRAVNDNRDLAESSGIDVQHVIRVVWLFAGGLATFGGILFGLAEQVSWQMGFQLLLLMFAAVILGGLGTAYGPLVGSLMVGIFVQMWGLWFPVELKNVGAFLVLILVLLFRPQGILGRAERVG